MSKPIDEQNEWVRDQLAKLWGDDEADYYVNPSRIVPTHKDTLNSSRDELIKGHQSSNNNNSHTPPSKLAKKTYNKGLYAQSIWESLRDDSGDKLKPYDLDKELQDTMNKFLRNGIREKNETAISLSKNNPQMMELKDVAEMNRIKQIKKYRNEIELMYRSSKMNEERVNVLRNDSPLPDLNDYEGRTSIIQYLPPIDLKTVSKRDRVDSTFEFANSTRQQLKLKQHLKAMLNSQMNDSNDLSLAEYKPNQLKASRTSFCQLGDQLVKLKFLENKPYSAFKSENMTPTQTDTLDDDLLDSNIHEDKTKSLVLYNPDDREIILKNDPSLIQYPPLSMNALMEYKPILKAPGVGEFGHGKNRIFKQIELA